MRARNIKPGFFQNEDLGDCKFESRLLFAGLWGLADRNGNLENRPRIIKSQVFPHDNLDVEPLLRELIGKGLIMPYEVDGKKYLSVPSWKKHARPHNKEPELCPRPSPKTPCDKPAAHESPISSGQAGNKSGKPETIQASPEKTGLVALNAECLNAESMNAECGMPPPDQKPRITFGYGTTPPELAQAWRGSVKRALTRHDELPDMTLMFEELIHVGCSGEELLAEIKARNRIEAPWDFSKRILKARAREPAKDDFAARLDAKLSAKKDNPP